MNPTISLKCKTIEALFDWKYGEVEEYKILEFIIMSVWLDDGKLKWWKINIKISSFLLKSKTRGRKM